MSFYESTSGTGVAVVLYRISVTHYRLPNILTVGDVMAGRTARTLPRDREDFIAASKEGVILVSFGSYFKFAMPDVVQQFCNAFTDRKKNR